MNDPLPGPGEPGSLSGPWLNLGSIALVPSLGRPRSATYRQIYLTNPWVWGAVNAIARGVSRNPLHVFELDRAAQKTRVRSDVPGRPANPAGADLDALLRGSVDRRSSRARWLATARDRLVYGNALWEIVESLGGGLPRQLVQLPWRDVIVHDDTGELEYEIVQRFGRSRRLRADSVVHFGLGADAESPVEVSPLESCRYTLALHEAVVRHLISYFANSARTSGHLKVDRLTPERAKEIRDMIAELYASPENAGRVMVTSGEWQSTSDSPDHSQVVELVRLSREEIAATYGVPPPVVGILEQAIKSNVKELREQFLRDGIGIWAGDFESELQAQLIDPRPQWAGLFAEFQLAEALRPDLEARSSVYQRLQPYFTVDEIRGFENMRPLDMPGVTDVPWVASGAMPMSQFAGGANPFNAAALAGLSDGELELVAGLLRARLHNGNGHGSEVLA